MLRDPLMPCSFLTPSSKRTCVRLVARLAHLKRALAADFRQLTGFGQTFRRSSFFVSKDRTELNVG